MSTADWSDGGVGAARGLASWTMFGGAHFGGAHDAASKALGQSVARLLGTEQGLESGLQEIMAAAAARLGAGSWPHAAVADGTAATEGLRATIAALGDEIKATTAGLGAFAMPADLLRAFRSASDARRSLLGDVNLLGAFGAAQLEARSSLASTAEALRAATAGAGTPWTSAKSARDAMAAAFAPLGLSSRVSPDAIRALFGDAATGSSLAARYADMAQEARDGWGRYARIAAETQEIGIALRDHGRDIRQMFERQAAEMVAPLKALREIPGMFTGIGDALEELRARLRSRDELRRGRRHMVRRAKRLGQAGWTMPLELAPVEIDRVLADGRRGRRASVDRWFVDHYEERLDAVAERLRKSPRLRRWRRSLHACLFAYRSRKYALVIPTALAVLEGIVTEFVGLSGRETMKHDTWTKRVPKPRSRILFDVESWYSAGSFLAAVWAWVPFWGERPAGLNRHLVLHGRVPGMGRRADALRLLVGIGFIAELMDELAIFLKARRRRRRRPS